MQASGDQGNKSEDDQVSWWFKLMTRGVGTVGGVIAMILGIVGCLTFTPSCLVGAILEICIGFVAVVLEAPCCCPFLDFIDSIGKFSESRPYWQKGALYTLIAIVPILLCISTSTILGSALVFGTGVLYGMMALGKKASRQEMAVNTFTPKKDVEMNAGLVGHEQPHSTDAPSK